MTSPLRLGILGCAAIAHPFVEAQAGSRRVRVEAVASRDGARARAFAERHRLPRVVDGYEAMLADPDLDAVYIPLPNSLHLPWAEAALRAGKHVLCEKPLTLSLADSRRLFDTARAADRVLMEAFPWRWQPMTQAMLDLAAGGAIGAPRLLQAYFGFHLGAGPNIRLDPGLGGGARLDVGCYVVSLAMLVFDRTPRAVQAVARSGPSGVDLALMGTLDFGDGVLAQLGSAMDAAPRRHALLVGTHGSLETDFANHTVAPAGHLRVHAPGDPAVPAFERGSGFRFEAEHFARRVAGDLPGRDPADESWSLRIAATLDALAASAAAGGAPVAVTDPA